MSYPRPVALAALFAWGQPLDALRGWRAQTIGILNLKLNTPGTHRMGFTIMGFTIENPWTGAELALVLDGARQLRGWQSYG